jgi:hypothetical protein
MKNKLREASIENPVLWTPVVPIAASAAHS